MSVTKSCFWNLTDVTLADEDTKSIPTDNVNRAIPGNVAMHVTQPGDQLVPSGGQICNQCKWRHLVAKIGTNASSATWWPKLEPMLIASHVGQIWNQFWWHHLVVKFWTNTSGTTQLAKFGISASGILFSWRDNSRFRLYTLGPLCLWQCLHLWMYFEELEIFSFIQNSIVGAI